jgi:pimeloyl-ACP methyl ester carboxylesterase
MRLVVLVTAATLLAPGQPTAAAQKASATTSAAKSPAPWQKLPLPPAMPTADETGYADSSGAKIYFASFGKGTPVILLHGGMGNGDHWSHQVRELSRTFRVITIDSRGHGRSTRSKDRPGYAKMATDVIAVMDQLKLEKAAIVGWSDGGEIGLKLAIHHPDRVSKLVVFGTNYDASGSKKRSGTSTTFSSYFAKCKSDYAKLSATPKQYDAAQKWLLPIWRDPMGFSKDQLKKISAPTLFVHGKYDEIIKQEHVEEMAKLVPNARFAMIDDASHFLLWQAPASLNKLLADFLTAAR